MHMTVEFWEFKKKMAQFVDKKPQFREEDKSIQSKQRIEHKGVK